MVNHKDFLRDWIHHFHQHPKGVIWSFFNGDDDVFDDGKPW